MKKRSRMLLIFLGICAFGSVGFYFLYSREPSFEGKSFTQWVWLMDRKPPGPEKEAARAVVRHLGTNSIPLLLRWLKERDEPSLRERVYELKYNLAFWLTRHHLIKPNSISLSFTGGLPNHRATSGRALIAFDPTSRMAVIPALIQMLEDPHHKTNEASLLAGNAYCALPMLAPECVGPLIDALTNTDSYITALTAGVLGTIGTNAHAAIPALEKRLTDQNPYVRIEVAQTIGKLGGNPDKFLPVVVQSLPEINQEDRNYYLDILVRYKEHAKSAVPVLLNILNKIPESNNPTNMLARNDIIYTLQQLDPKNAPEIRPQEASH